MKKILITGANSYIGTSFETWVNQWPDQYQVDTIDLIDNTWREKSFVGYDVIYHVAGIAHIKENKDNQELYYTVNRDLAISVAKKAKSEGVKQFIFLSTMSVYGLAQGNINKSTSLSPKNSYGDSKLQAESEINKLSNNDFKVVIVRPPMVYGPNCLGNYSRLSKMVKKIPFFLDIKNNRSMIFIDNLSEFIRLVITHSSSGIFFPQNEEYVCTSELVKLIALENNKKMVFVKIPRIITKLFNFNIMIKLFGDLIYDKELSAFKNTYNIFNFEQSIRITEGKNEKDFDTI